MPSPAQRAPTLRAQGLSAASLAGIGRAMEAWQQLLVSAGAVALLVALAFLLGFRAAPRLDAIRARAEAEASLAGLSAADVLVSGDGDSALVRGKDATLALVVRRADRFVVRRLGEEARLAPIAGGLAVDCREAGLRQVRLMLDAPLPEWTCRTPHAPRPS